MGDVEIKFVPNTGELNASLADATKKLEALQGEAQGLKSSFDAAVQSKDLQKIEQINKRLVEIKNEFVTVDKRRLDLQNKINQKVVDEKKAHEANLAKLRQSREEMEKVAQVGTRLAAAGAAILAPLLLAANKYKDALGSTEEPSRRLIAASEKLEQVQIRIGRVVAASVAPALEKAAGFAESAAAFAEKNPGIISGATTVGGVLAGTGLAVTGAAQALQSVKTLQLLSESGGATGALANLSIKAAQVAMVAGAVYLGMRGGNVLGNAINRAAGKEERSFDDALVNLRQAGALAVQFAGQGFNALSHGGFNQGVNRAFGFGNAAPTAALSSYRAGETGGYAGKSDLQRAQEQIERNKEESRLAIVKEYGDKRVKAEATAAQAAITALQSYNADAAAMAAKLAEIERDGNEQLQTLREQHNKDMAKLEREHGRRVTDLTNARDALGLAEEKRNYKEQKAEARQNYNDQRRALERQIADAVRAQEAEIAARRRAYEQELSDLMAAKSREIAVARQTEQAKLALLLGTLRSIQSAAPYSSTYSTAGNNRNRAAGGYMDFGAYTVGESGREFALNASTTRAAESIIGGQLNQQNLLRAMSVNFNLSNGVTLAQTHKIVRGETAAIMRGLSSAFGGI